MSARWHQFPCRCQTAKASSSKRKKSSPRLQSCKQHCLCRWLRHPPKWSHSDCFAIANRWRSDAHNLPCLLWAAGNTKLFRPFGESKNAQVPTTAVLCTKECFRATTRPHLARICQIRHADGHLALAKPTSTAPRECAAAELLSQRQPRKHRQLLVTTLLQRWWATAVGSADLPVVQALATRIAAALRLPQLPVPHDPGHTHSHEHCWSTRLAQALSEAKEILNSRENRMERSTPSPHEAPATSDLASVKGPRRTANAGGLRLCARPAQRPARAR